MYSMTINGQRYEVTGGAKLTPNQYGALSRRKYESLLWEQEKREENLFHRITCGAGKSNDDIMDVDHDAERSGSSASEGGGSKPSGLGPLPKLATGAKKATAKAKASASNAMGVIKTTAAKAAQSVAAVTKRQTDEADAKAARKVKQDSKPSSKKRKADAANRKEAAKEEPAELIVLHVERIRSFKEDDATDIDAFD